MNLIKIPIKSCLCLFLLLFLFGCASTHSVVPGMDLDTAIKEAAAQMETRFPAGTRIALVSVASPSNAFSTQVLTRLESELVSSGKLVVVDRANLDKVRAEQGFQLSGEVDDASATNIGRLLGAGAIVTGTLANLGDVYSLNLKAINIQTATVSMSYLAELAKTRRIETLLSTRDGTVTAGTSTAGTQPTAVSAPAQPAVPVYRIGDTGPAGGIIFYDKGNNSGGWRYLEAAPASSEFRAQWGGYSLYHIDGISVEIGTGKSNTQKVVAILEERGEIGRAAHRCTMLNINGFTDWFLPSKNELAWMYMNLKEKGLGDFGNDTYWSSSFAGYDTWANASIWVQNFRNGNQGQNSGYSGRESPTHLVRAIRQF